jgi:hypothetical protein
VAAQIEGDDADSAPVRPLGKKRIASGMLGDTVHQCDDGARRGRQPALRSQRQAVGGFKRPLLGVHRTLQATPRFSADRGRRRESYMARHVPDERIAGKF